jgi:ion channel
VAVFHHRYGFVLGLILLAISFELAAPPGDWARFAAICIQAATLIAALLASRAHRWVVRAAGVGAVLLVAASLISLITSKEFGSDSLEVINLLLVLLASPAIVTGLIKHYREEERLTIQSMFAVLCLYLLLGLAFASAFAAVQALTDKAFFQTGAGDTQDFIYFSFTTITTTGYGDLAAVTNLGRSLAITEQLVGQIYLVTVVALIVGNLGAGGRRIRR